MRNFAQFLQSRTWRQWAAAGVWLWLVEVVVVSDFAVGRQRAAIAEAILYLAIFIGATWHGWKSSRRA